MTILSNHPHATAYAALKQLLNQPAASTSSSTSSSVGDALAAGYYLELAQEDVAAESAYVYTTSKLDTLQAEVKYGDRQVCACWLVLLRSDDACVYPRRASSFSSALCLHLACAGFSLPLGLGMPLNVDCQQANWFGETLTLNVSTTILLCYYCPHACHV